MLLLKGLARSLHFLRTFIPQLLQLVLRHLVRFLALFVVLTLLLIPGFLQRLHFLLQLTFLRTECRNHQLLLLRRMTELNPSSLHGILQVLARLLTVLQLLPDLVVEPLHILEVEHLALQDSYRLL
jgi:hypothetical protein